MAIVPDDIRPLTAHEWIAALDAAVDAVILLDTTGRIVHANRAAADAFGLPSAAAGLQLAACGTGLPDLPALASLATTADDLPVQAPAVEAVGRLPGAGVRRLMTWEHPARNEVFELTASRRGRLLVLWARDVTPVRDESRRRDRLSRISEALAAAESPDQVAATITDLALPLVGAISGGVLVPDDEPDWVRALRWVGVQPQDAAAFVRYPIASATPGAEALRTGSPVWATLEDAYVRWSDFAEALRRTGALAVAGIPMIVGGERIGALVLQFPTEEPPDQATSDFLRTVAAVCAQALHRTRRLAEEHRIALTLQQSLLPMIPPRVSGLEVLTRYRPGDPGVTVGGDWYDVVPVHANPGQALLLVADVQGHDLAAAALMGQLRSVARAFAAEGHPPAALLRRLNGALADTGSDRIVTALAVLLEADTGIAVAASAGHPLAFTASSRPSDVPVGDGRTDGADAHPAWDVRRLPVEVGPPLGTSVSPDPGAGQDWPETTVVLPPGTRLIAFTDGLVESRTRDIDTAVGGLAALLAALAPAAPLAEVLDRALTYLPPGERGDDVAVLAAALPPARGPVGGGVPGESAPLRAKRVFMAQPLSVPLARRWVRDVLTGWEVPHERIQDAAVVVTELVSNAIRHSETPLTVALQLEPEAGTPRVRRRLMLEVHDDSHRRPQVREGNVEADSGRGLLLVGSLADSFDIIEDERGGKTIRAGLLLP